MFLPQCERPSFTPIRNNRQNYSFQYYYDDKIKNYISKTCSTQGINE
jgi:hypothetical protein